MFGIGGFELFIILIFGFLIFGPEKLPEIAKTVGKGIARFREAQQEMNETLGGEKLFDPNNPDEPFKDPVEVLDKIAQRQEEKKAAKAGGDASRPQSNTAPFTTSAASASNPVAAPASTASTASESTEADDDASAPARQESFTERKARYERERAARKAAEKQAAESAPSTQTVTAKEKTSSGIDETATPQPAEAAIPQATEAATPQPTEAASPSEGGDA